MKSSLLLSPLFGLSWMLCPEALTIGGNISGRMGWWVLAALIVIGLLFTFCNRILADDRLPVSLDREFLILQKGLGAMGAATCTLAAAVPLVILASTALLVTAGYAFNEIFLYWFPTFGFAALLLLLLTLLHLLPEEKILAFQWGFLILCAAGLVALCLAGLLKHGMDVSLGAAQQLEFSWVTPLPLLLLFVGSSFSTQAGSTQPPVLLFLPLSLLLIWFSISIALVPFAKLADSTIPYGLTARVILGEWGRRIMGVVVISGTCGALTGLMVLNRRLIGGLAIRGMAPRLFLYRKQGWSLVPLLAGAIGLCLLSGLAGRELLDSLLRGALILCLLYQGILILSALHWTGRLASWRSALPLLPGPLLLLCATLALLIQDERRGEITLFIAAVLLAGSLLSGSWFFCNRRAIHTLHHKENTP